MAIDDKDIIMAQGPRTMGERKKAGDAQREDAAGYTLHHILPYRYPLFIGYLAEQFVVKYAPGVGAKGDGTEAAAQGQQEVSRWPKAAKSEDRVYTMVRKTLEVVARFGAAQTRAIRHQMAWLGPNLFTGPSPGFRTDDPGDGREATKPAAMTPKLWKDLNDLGDWLDAKVTLTSDPQGYVATLAEPMTVGEFRRLLEELAKFEERGHGKPYGFDASDWIVMEYTGQEDQKTRDLRIEQEGTPPDAVRKHFAQVEQGARHQPQPTMTYFRPDPNTGDEPRTMMWRLRHADEAVPQAGRNARTQPDA